LVCKIACEIFGFTQSKPAPLPFLRQAQDKLAQAKLKLPASLYELRGAGRVTMEKRTGKSE